MKREYPPLWRKRDAKQDSHCVHDSITYESLLEQFSYKPEPKRWTTICKNSLVVGQECALTCYFLARHRLAESDEQRKPHPNNWSHKGWSLGILLASLLIVVIMRKFQTTRQRSRGWFFDSIHLVARLVLLATTLKILTNSHFCSNTITIYALAVAGMAIHLLGCDYSFANGMETKSAESSSPLSSSKSTHCRHPITLSNAAVFSTTMLASQLQSHWNTFLFVTAAVALFSLHPSIRHNVHTTSPQVAPHGKLTHPRLCEYLKKSSNSKAAPQNRCD